MKYKYVSENPNLIKSGTTVMFNAEERVIAEASDKTLRLEGDRGWISIYDVDFILPPEDKPQTRGGRRGYDDRERITDDPSSQQYYGRTLHGAGGRVVSDAVVNDVVEWIGKDATPVQIREVLDYLLTEPGLKFPDDFRVIGAKSPEDQGDKAERIVENIYAHDIQPGMLDEIGEKTVKAILWGMVMTATTTNLKGKGTRLAAADKKLLDSRLGDEVIAQNIEDLDGNPLAGAGGHTRIPMSDTNEKNIIDLYESRMKRWLSNASKMDSSNLYQEDYNDHKFVIDQMRKGNWALALKAWQDMDTASRDNITDAAWELLMIKNNLPAYGKGKRLNLDAPANGCSAANGTFYLEIGNIINEKDSAKTTTLYRYEILRYDKNAEGKSVAVVKEATATESKPTPEFTITLENICNHLISGLYSIDGRSLTILGSIAIAHALLETETKYIEQKLKCAESHKEIDRLKAEIGDLKGDLEESNLELEHYISENNKLVQQFESQKRGLDDTLAGVGAMMGGEGGMAGKGKKVNPMYKKSLEVLKTPLKLAKGEKQYKGIPYIKDADVGMFMSVADHDKFNGTYWEMIDHQYSSLHDLKWKVDEIIKDLNEAVGGKMHGLGARIPNNYKGKTPAQVWDTWDTAQREHFYLDHLEMLPKGNISKTISRPFAGLDSSIQDIISEHIRGGQYGLGKRIPDADFSTEDESTVAEFLKGKSIKTYLHGPDGDSEEIKGFRVSDKKYSRRTCYVKVANDYEYKFDLKDLAEFLKGSTIEITTDRGERMDIELATPMKGAGFRFEVGDKVGVHSDDINWVVKERRNNLGVNFYTLEYQGTDSEVSDKTAEYDESQLVGMHGAGAVIGSVALGFLTARLYDYYKEHKVEKKVNVALKGKGTKVKKPRATSNWNVETKDGKKVTVISSTRPMKNWTRTTIDADGGKAVVIAKTLGRA